MGGSGSLAAMSILESEFKDGMTSEEGIALVAKAISAGIFNDLGSGSNVDVCVITAGQTKLLRNYVKPNERKFKASYQGFAKGTTTVIKQDIMKLITVEEATTA